MLAALLFCVAFAGEETFEQAQQHAVKAQKPLLLIFSGSDWCRPCMQLKADILDAEHFKAFADSTLVVFVADLPRNKSTLTEAQLAENRALAAKYNPAGQFPQLILFKDGKPVKSISGTFTSFLALKAWIESE